METGPLGQLSTHQKESLKKGGIHDIPSLLLSSPQELSQRCRISSAEAQKLIDTLYVGTLPPRLQRLEDMKHEWGEICTTGDPALDKALGGGLRPGMIWEIVGESAAGKTQFALQLALFAQLPKERGGLCGSTCYLTTSSVLPTNRLVQISQAHPLLSTLESGLQDVHTISTPTIPILTHVLSEMVPTFVQDQLKKPRQKPIKLLVIDALAELFHTADKTTTTTLVERSKNVAEISLLLHTLADKYKIVILVLNEVIDAFERDYRVDANHHDLLYREQSRWFAQAHTIPGENRKEASLGLAWANQVNVRILLSRTGRRRYLDDTADYTKRHRSESYTGPGPPMSVIDVSTESSTLVRRLSIIFSSVCSPVSLDYIVTDVGISTLHDEIQHLRHEETTPRSVPSNPGRAISMADTPHGGLYSQISPLDIGTAEARKTAIQEIAQEAGDVEPAEDEWDKYWASEEISTDVYNTLDLKS